MHIFNITNLLDCFILGRLRKKLENIRMNKSECAFFSASPISSHSKATGNIFLVIDECIFRSGFQNLKETSKECKYHALCSPIPPKVSFLAAFFSVKTVFFASTSPLGDNCMLGSCLFNERYVFSSIFFFFGTFSGLRNQLSSCHSICSTIC